MKTIKEVRVIRDEIKALGERSFPELEAEWNKANVEWGKARDKMNKIQVEIDRTMAEWEKAQAEKEIVRAEMEKAQAEWDRAGAEWDIKLFSLLTTICPEAYYKDYGDYRDGKGYLSIPKDKESEWIIPTFAGTYQGVRHEAFSIWEISRYGKEKPRIDFNFDRRTKQVVNPWYDIKWAKEVTNEKEE